MNIGLLKIDYNGKKGLKLSDYAAEKAKTEKLKGQAGIDLIKATANYIYRDGYELPEGIDMKAVKKLKATVKEDIEASVASRKEAKEAKAKEAEEAKALKEKRQKDANALILKVLPKTQAEISKKLEPLMDKVAADQLGGGFKIKNGNLVAAKKDLTPQDFATGFGALQSLVKINEAMGKGFAKWEAQMALIAKKHYGDDWGNYYQVSPDRLMVVRANMKALEVAKEAEVDLPEDMNIGVLRVLTEAKVANGKENDEKNKEFKKSVLEAYAEKSEEKGEKLTAKEARNLLVELKKEAGAIKEAKKHFNFVLIFAVKGKGGAQGLIHFGMNERDPALFSRALYVFDRSLNSLSVEGNKIVADAIKEPSEQQIEALKKEGISFEKKKEKGKKGKKDEEETEEEGEEEEEEEEKPKKEKAGKKEGKKSFSLEEDDDEDEKEEEKDEDEEEEEEEEGETEEEEEEDEDEDEDEDEEEEEEEDEDEDED